MSDVLLIIQILSTIGFATVMLGIALSFFRDLRTAKHTLAQASTLLNPEGDLTLTLQEARSFMAAISQPELRKDLLSGLASELLETFNYWRMGVKSGENKKYDAVTEKLTDVFIEEIGPEMIDDPILSKLLKIATKNQRVKNILAEYDLTLLDVLDLAGPLLQNVKLGALAPPGETLAEPAQSEDGVIWFIDP